MNPDALHILETIHQRNHVEHMVAVNGMTVALNNGHAMVDGLAVTSYYCALCFRHAADNGGADATTGTGPCVHKAAVADALRLVKEGA